MLALCVPSAAFLKTPLAHRHALASTRLAAEPNPSEMKDGDGFWKGGVYYKIEGKREVPTYTPNPEKAEFAKRAYFFGKVTVGLGEGYKPMTETFAPSFKDDQSSLAVVEVPLPLGMVIEESETLEKRIQVAEVTEGSNAEKAGIKVGDVVRAVTAQKRDNMGAAESSIAFNALAGATTQGIKIRKAIFMTDGQGFDNTFDALLTNSDKQGGNNRVALVLERHFD